MYRGLPPFGKWSPITFMFAQEILRFLPRRWDLFAEQEPLRFSPASLKARFFKPPLEEVTLFSNPGAPPEEPRQPLSGGERMSLARFSYNQSDILVPIPAPLCPSPTYDYGRPYLSYRWVHLSPTPSVVPGFRFSSEGPRLFDDVPLPVDFLCQQYLRDEFPATAPPLPPPKTDHSAPPSSSLHRP